MRKFTKFLFVFSVLLMNSIDAQTVVKNDTISGTPLTISMDSRIDAIMEKAEESCSRAGSFDRSSDMNTGIPATPKIRVPEKPKSQAEICRQNPRIMGYKIQLSVVKSNEEAKEVGMYFRRRFPNIKVEIDASLRPNYKVLAGSYLTKESAAPDLKRIREYFKSAISVQYRVFCVEAK
ncbi:MAG: SPOR domain-containing protein [Bergeyella sp.]